MRKITDPKTFREGVVNEFAKVFHKNTTLLT